MKSIIWTWFAHMMSGITFIVYNELWQWNMTPLSCQSVVKQHYIWWTHTVRMSVSIQAIMSEFDCHSSSVWTVTYCHNWINSNKSLHCCWKLQLDGVPCSCSLCIVYYKSFFLLSNFMNGATVVTQLCSLHQSMIWLCISNIKYLAQWLAPLVLNSLHVYRCI